MKPISTRDATTYIYTVFRLLGIDDLNRTWLYILYSIQLNITSCILQLVGFTASYVISSSKMTIGAFLTSLQVAINVYTVVLKIIVMYFCMPRLRKTEAILNALDKKIEGNQEREVAKRMIWLCRRLVVIYCISYFTYSISTFLVAVANGRPPYGLYIPYCHWDESTTKLVIASLIEFYLINISCLQDVGLDAYPVTFIYIARMHMKILCIRVEGLGRDPTKTKEENVKALIDCIDTHRKILDLIETVRPIISKTIFIQFIVTAAVMGITLINIMMFSTITSAIASITFILAVTMETLPLCYTMNVLIEQMYNLPTSTFHCEWVGQSKAFRKMMVFFMQNAQKFNNIIAGNILPVQISTFLSVGFSLRLLTVYWRAFEPGRDTPLIAKLAFSIYALVNKMEERRTAHAALGIE